MAYNKSRLLLGERGCHSFLKLALQLDSCVSVVVNKFKEYFKLWFNKRYILYFSFLLKVYLNNLYTHCGAWIYDPEIKRGMLLWLSRPGACLIFLFILRNTCVWEYVHICVIYVLIYVYVWHVWHIWQMLINFSYRLSIK